MRSPPLTMAAAMATATIALGSAHADPLGPFVEHRLFSPGPQQFGLFGYSVAVKGPVMIVGAFGEDGVEPSTGAAYVYRRVAGAWVQEARLIAPDGHTDDLFATSVTLDGDTVVLGSPRAVTPDGIPCGAAYVFRRVAGQWGLEAELFPSDRTPFGDFGYDLGVALSGDTLVVGADGPEDDGLPGLAAYVFTRRGTAWTQTAVLTNPDSATPAGFGDTVSIDGKTIVVGASLEADGAGAAYVFRLQHDRWVKQARLAASDPTPGAAFGFSTAIDGETIAVGATSGLNDAGLDSGAAYVFERRDGGWAQTARLAPADGKTGNSFGYRVAVADELVAVGALKTTSPAGVTTGAVYLYQPAHHAWSQQAELFPSDGARIGRFGCSLATDGRTLLVGNGVQRIQGVAFVGEAYTYDLGDD